MATTEAVSPTRKKRTGSDFGDASRCDDSTATWRVGAAPTRDARQLFIIRQIFLTGAGDRFRTDDLALGKHTLYQLNYTRPRRLYRRADRANRFIRPGPGDDAPTLRRDHGRARDEVWARRWTAGG